MTTEYRVSLDAFEGPLDLLLFLIRRAEVDVTDIPIARIADQYADFLATAGGLERVDIDTAGDFLVMAATLMEIKSRMLAPPRPEGAEEDGAGEGSGERTKDSAPDPRAELVRQLLEYKKFRDAASILEVKRTEWESRYPASGSAFDAAALRGAVSGGEGIDLDDAVLIDLAQAFHRIIQTVNLDRLGDHHVMYDDTPIELHAADLLDRLRREAADGREMPLASVLTGRTRSEMIGLFLAVLELVRRREIAVKQAAPGGEIAIGLRAAETAEPAPPG